MKLQILAGTLALALAACSLTGGEQPPHTAEQRDAAIVELKGLGLRNIAGLYLSDTTAEGFATYRGERVRFLYNGANGRLSTYELRPPVP